MLCRPLARCSSRIRKAPAMRGAGVHLDFGGQVRLDESLLNSRDRDQELRLALRALQVRTVRLSFHECAAMSCDLKHHLAAVAKRCF